MQERRSTAVTLLVILFLVHGVLYFVFPEAVRDETSPVKLIKYVVLGLIGLVAFERLRIEPMVIFACTACVLLVFHYAASAELNAVNYLQYLIPLATLVLYPHMRDVDFRLVARVTLVTASLFAYIEVLVLRGVYRAYYVDGAYRATSIFVSPNVLGPMVALATLYLFVSRRQQRAGLAGAMLDFLMVANAALVVLLTGSKTGMVTALLAMGAYFLSRSGLRMAHLVGLSVAMFAFAVVVEVAGVQLLGRILDVFTFEQGAFGESTIRDLNFGSGEVRLSEYSMFMEFAQRNFLFPWSRHYIYVDNAYLHIWGTFGFPVLLIFLLFNLVVAHRALQARDGWGLFTVALFLLIGLSTNFPYLWPLAYIYWYVALRIVARAAAGAPANVPGHSAPLRLHGA